MDKSLVKEGYDKAAQAYLQGRDQFKNNAYLDKLVRLLKPESTILDIGCGAGKPIDRYLVDRGFKVIGLDVSEKQIELARANVPEASYEVRDMSDLREGDFHVDAVVSFYAIFHIPRESHARLFRTINSFLPAGGLMLVTMGTSDWEGVEPDFFGVTMAWSHYDAEKNREIITEAGFKIILDEIDTSGGERHQVVLAQKA